MSLYQALPPAHGQAAAKPLTTVAPPLAASKPPILAFFPSRLHPRPPLPRALLNIAAVKPNPPPPAAVSSSPHPAAATPPISTPAPSHSAVQPTVTVVPSLFDSVDDDGAEGDDALLQALAETADAYDPRRPNEWEHFVAWKATQSETAPATVEADEEEEEGERDQDTRDAARARQRGFQFRYSYDQQADAEAEAQPPPRPPSPLLPPALPTPIAAPLQAKQEALATASGEDAYMRRLRLSAQSRPQPPAEPAPPAPLPRPPPLLFLPNPGPPPTSTPSRVVLLTVANPTLLSTHSTCHLPFPPYPRHSFPTLPPHPLPMCV